MKTKIFLWVLVSAVAFAALSVSIAGRAASSKDASKEKTPATVRESAQAEHAKPDKGKVGRIVKTDAEWKETLNKNQYRILREKGTEVAFTGKYWNDKSDGTYLCAGCGLELFDSKTKFKSGTGWPSFYQSAGEEHVGEIRDSSFGMVRTEIVCNRCGGHLGHVFNDGPRPSGLRYCVNSASLEFKARDQQAKDETAKAETAKDEAKTTDQ